LRGKQRVELLINSVGKRMEQKEFTNYIIPKINDRFPQFKDFCTLKSNDIIDIDFKSKNNNLTLWLTTQDKEITLGFTGDQDCDWHTHMSLFGANTPDEELQVAINLIDNIINDKEQIIHSTELGYFITDDIEGLNKYKQPNEIIKTFYWSEL